MLWVFWNNFIVFKMLLFQVYDVSEGNCRKIYHERRYNSSTVEKECYSQRNLLQRDNLAMAETLVETRSTVLNDVISNLGWTFVDLFYQDNAEHFHKHMDLDYVIEKLHKSNIRTAVHTTGGGNKFQVLHSLWKNRESGIHVVVIGNLSFLDSFLHQADEFDIHSVNYRKTAMYLKSYWILLPSSEENIDQSLLNHSNMDNVLLIDMIKYMPEFYTLMWRMNFTRQFERRAFRSSMTKDSVQHLFPNSNFGFNGRELVSSTLEWKNVIEISEVNGKMVIIGGICGEIVEILSETLNFTHRVIKPTDEEWGTLNDNGNWTGLIGQIQRREADISFTTLSIQSARAEVVDFTTPFLFGHSQFMMRVLGPEHNKWQIYMKPYSLLVYIFMLISVSACGLCVYIFEVRFSYNAMKSYRKLTLVEVLLYFYGAMVLQARPRVPWCICSRVVICSYWIACISLAAVYCGSLVANMAITHTDKIYFDTLEDLVAQSDYKWGYMGGAFWDVAFKTSRLRVYNKVYDGTHKFYKTDPDVLALDPEVHIQKMKSEKYVFIGGSSLLNRKHCEDYRLVLSPDKFLEDKMAFALPKDSALTEIFSKRLMQLRERGIISHIRQKHIALDNCSQSSFLRKGPLSIEDVQSSFYILLIGVALSSLTLLIECVIYNI